MKKERGKKGNLSLGWWERSNNVSVECSGCEVNK